MVTLRFAVPAILAAAAVAGCFSYFVALPVWVETDARLSDARLPPAVLYSTGPNARASTGINQPPMRTTKQPQPTKKRPRRS
jgi:hypothetical protein